MAMTAEDVGAISPEYLDMLKRMALAPKSRESFAEFGPKWGGFRQGVQGLVDGVERGRALSLFADESKRIASAQAQFGQQWQQMLSGSAVPAMARPVAQSSMTATNPAPAAVQQTTLPEVKPQLPGTSVDTSGAMRVPAMALPRQVPDVPAARSGPTSNVPGTSIDYGGSAPTGGAKPPLPGMMRLGGPKADAAPAPAAEMFPSVADAPARPSGGVDRTAFGEQWRDPTTRRALIGNAWAEVGDQVGRNPDVARAKIETIANRASARGMTLAQAATDARYYPGVTLQRMQRLTPEIEAQYGPLVDDVASGSNVARYATGNASGQVGFAGGPQTFQAPGTYERFGIEGPDRGWADRMMKLGGPRAPASVQPVADRGGALPAIWNGANVMGEATPAVTRGMAGQALQHGTRPGFQAQIPERATTQAAPNFQKVAPAQYDAMLATLMANRYLTPEQKQSYAKMLERHAPLTEQQQIEIDTARMKQEQLRRELETPAAKVGEVKGGSSLYTVDPRTGALTWHKAPGGGQQDAFRKKFAEKAPEYYMKASEGLDAADQTTQMVREMQSLVPHIISGSWAGARMEVAKALNSLGVANFESVAPTEMFQSLAQKFIGQEGQKYKPLSNSDITFIERGLPNIQKDPQSIPHILGAMETVAARDRLAKRLELEALREGRPPDVAEIRAAVNRRVPSYVESEFGDRAVAGGGARGPAPSAPAAPTQKAAPSLRQQAQQLPEGGSMVINGVPYVRRGAQLIPAQDAR